MSGGSPAAAHPGYGVPLTGGSSAGASEQVPVVGRTTIRLERRADRARVVALVHGVRRVPGGTVLYWSVGLPKGADPEGYFGPLAVTRPRSLQDRFSNGPAAGVQLLDGAGHKVYTTLIDAPNGNALASPNDALIAEPGVLSVLYAVFPELPADVRTVDVVVGENDIVPGVPVQEGPLEPVKPADGPIRLGEGWPQLDLDAIRSSHRPQDGIYTWATEIVDLGGEVTTRQRSKDVSVDLSADVLFAVDSDKLTPASQRAIAAAAGTINKKASGGVLSVAGHTDASGSDAHNDDLSRRRAQAVAQALRPLVTVPGVTWEVVGKGEREPVESNDSAEGRKANRRVSVTFTPKEGR